MSTRRKILFSVLLIAAIVASMVVSLGLLSRPTFEYDTDKTTGELVFSGYNGNENFTQITIGRPMVRVKTENGTAWQPDETRSVTAVKRYTIQNDEFLETITVGPDVSRIDECAFLYCKKLKAIRVDPANRFYADVDGVLFTKDLKTLLLYPVAHETNGERTKTYAVPEGVERLARNSFYKCDALEEVTFPDSLREIGSMSFFKCESLKLVDLPESVTSLGSDAFSYCKSMKYAFYIPAGVNTIDHHCFYKCENLSRFYVGCKEDEISLGGQWMPKSENSFKADDAVFEASVSDRDAYNAERAAEEKPQQEEESKDKRNQTAVIVLIVCVFIPSVALVGVEVIRSLFRDDFMMTNKGRARLRRQQAEKEAIHQAYLSGGYNDPEGEGDGENG